MLRISWFGLSLLGLVLVTPGWLAIAFFGKNFHFRGEVSLIWYGLGMVVGTVLFLLSRKTSGSALVPGMWPVIGLFLIGIVFGSLANMAIFRAVETAPNAGLPVAISNVSSILVFLAAILLARLAPKYFEAATFNPYHLLGIMLALAGITIISLK